MYHVVHRVTRGLRMKGGPKVASPDFRRFFLLELIDYESFIKTLPSLNSKRGKKDKRDEGN